MPWLTSPDKSSAPSSTIAMAAAGVRLLAVFPPPSVTPKAMLASGSVSGAAIRDVGPGRADASRWATPE